MLEINSADRPHIRLTGKLFGNKEMRLLMLGLDAAGKTSEWWANVVTDWLD